MTIGYTLLGYGIGCALGAGIYSYIGHRKRMPKFSIEICKHSVIDYKTYGIGIIYNQHNNPYVHSKDTKNLDCLLKKGYRYNRKSDYYRYEYDLLLYEFWKEDKDIDINVFLEDCCECNVHTNIKYKEKSFFGDEYNYKKKQIPWNTKHVSEEEKWTKV